MNRTLAALLISYPLLAFPAGASETLREQSEHDLDSAGITTVASSGDIILTGGGS